VALSLTIRALPNPRACRTPCRSAVWAPPGRRHDSTPVSLRRPHPLQRHVRRHPSTSTLPKRRGSLANASSSSPWPSSLWRFHLVAKAARFSSARVPQNSEPRAETCEVSLPALPLATSCSLHPRTSDSRFGYHHLPSRRLGSSRTIHTFRETRGTRMLGTESSLNWSFDPSHQACASNALIGIGASTDRQGPLPHHPACGSAPGGSRS
jgi:hypothetical protein